MISAVMAGLLASCLDVAGDSSDSRVRTVLAVYYERVQRLKTEAYSIIFQLEKQPKRALSFDHKLPFFCPIFQGDYGFLIMTGGYRSSQFNFSRWQRPTVHTNWAIRHAYVLKQIIGGCLPKVFEINLNSRRFFSRVLRLNFLDFNVRSELMSSCSLGQRIGFASLDSSFSIFLLRDAVVAPSFIQSPNNEQSSDAAKHRSDPSRKYLFFGGVRSSYLGIQIACLVLVGFTLSALAGYSLFRRFNYGNKKWRWSLLALISCASALIFWGWAWGGHPLLTWGIGN